MWNRVRVEAVCSQAWYVVGVNPQIQWNTFLAGETENIGGLMPSGLWSLRSVEGVLVTGSRRPGHSAHSRMFNAGLVSGESDVVSSSVEQILCGVPVGNRNVVKRGPDNHIRGACSAVCGRKHQLKLAEEESGPEGVLMLYSFCHKNVAGRHPVWSYWKRL